MKAYVGVNVYTHIFLTSALVGGERSASRPVRFAPGKEPRYPVDRRSGGPQNRSGRRGEEKILYPTGTRNSDPLVVQPVAVAIPALPFQWVKVKKVKLSL
jgi:hypothetical protein